MRVESKRENLHQIYSDFEEASHPFRTGSICTDGCAFCCTHYGSLDVTTVEGFLIYEWVENTEKTRHHNLWRKIRKNMKQKESGKPSRCPFLNKKNRCIIYDIRPFSCRQLYSLKPCAERGPVVHRQAVGLSKETVKKLQHVDENGYSGHISFILHLIKNPKFRKQYRAGEFNPSEIETFGKIHNIIINQWVK